MPEAFAMSSLVVPSLQRQFLAVNERMGLLGTRMSLLQQPRYKNNVSVSFHCRARTACLFVKIIASSDRKPGYYFNYF